MLNPRLRARDKLQAWRDKQRANDRSWSMEKVRAGFAGWDSSKASRLFSAGPMLEDLDDVERMTGIPARDLIAREDAEQDVPVNATEREFLYWYRLAPEATRHAVGLILSDAATKASAKDTRDVSRMPETPMRVLHGSHRKRTAP